MESALDDELQLTAAINAMTREMMVRAGIAFMTWDRLSPRVGRHWSDLLTAAPGGVTCRGERCPGRTPADTPRCTPRRLLPACCTGPILPVCTQHPGPRAHPTYRR